MEHYCLAQEGVEVDQAPLPFNTDEVQDADKVVIMKIKTGTQIGNITRYAHKSMMNEDQQQIVFCGSGPACSKVISAVEVFKRQWIDNKGCELCQLTRTRYRRLQDVWEPNEDKPELETLEVNRDLPCIYILLSKQSLPSNLAGYQVVNRDIPRIVNKAQTPFTKQLKTKRRNNKNADNKWKRPIKDTKNGKANPTKDQQ